MPGPDRARALIGPIENPRTGEWVEFLHEDADAAAPVRLRIEMRPPLRWSSFTRRFFAGEDPLGLLREFADEVVLPP